MRLKQLMQEQAIPHHTIQHKKQNGTNGIIEFMAEDDDGTSDICTIAKQEDEDDDVNMDDLFKSIIESKIIRKNPDSKNGSQLTTVYAEGVDLSDPLVNANLGAVLDIENMRQELPSLTEFKLKPSMIFKLVKDMIGKDLSKLSLPVFINEPFSIL